jgi:hypothetical protein
VESEAGCALLRPDSASHGPGTGSPRFSRYKGFSGDPGEEPPESVESSSTSEDRAYFSQDVATTLRAEQEGLTLATLCSLLSTIFFVAAPIVLAFAFGDFERRWVRWLVLGIGISALALSVVMALLGGAPLFVDNASDKAVNVSIDGRRLTLPPRTTTELTVHGGDVRVDVSSDTTPVESVVLHLDRSFGGMLHRGLIGTSIFTNVKVKYLYNICGINQYNDWVVHYEKKTGP